MAKPYAEILVEYPSISGCGRCGNPLGDLFYVIVERKPGQPEATSYLCWDCYGPDNPLEPYQHVVRSAVGPDGRLTITRV
jgi:hypothetical protein